MERFRPLIKQSSNFVDPLMANLKDDDTVSVGEDPITCLNAAVSDKLTLGHEDHFSSSHNTPMLGGSLPYTEEWAQICECAATDVCQKLGRSGQLRSCRFRCICWMVYLKVLPDNHTEWLRVIREERGRYETIRLKLQVTPGLGHATSDPLVDNPLSQDEESPWNQYFEDSELKKVIRQDVVRTFPEVEFFQSQRIRDLMVTVLFCYARQHPEVGYRQGMHEILAPLIFVLHCDHQAHQHAHEMDPTPHILQELMDEAYLEYDAYSMFEGVMKSLEPWYIVQKQSPVLDPRSSLLNAQPFARPQDIGPTNLLVQKLTSIHDNLLQRHDPALYNHLARLEIPPQIYGIRWIRLLFGREFPLQDLLMVWDAIFSDIQPSFPLVDFLTVAMLSFIREPLLVGDYTSCLKLLMRYPASADVHCIIQLALHLRNPRVYPRPTGYSSGATAHMPTVGGRPEVHRGPQQVTRSSSVPRTHPPQPSRHPSAPEQTSLDDHNHARRLSSPNAFTDPLNASVIFSSSHKKTGGNNSSNSHISRTGVDSTSTSDGGGSSSPGGTKNKVMSGLVRLGGKLGRPRELPVSRHLSIQSPATPPASTAVQFITTQSQGRKKEDEERPAGMKELSLVRTHSVPVQGHSSRTMPRLHSSHQSSDDSDNDSPEKKTSAEPESEGLSVEDLTAICLGCAMNLSHHAAALRTRLEQLQVQPDLTLRTALDGITEVIETLTTAHSSHSQGSSNKVKPCPAPVPSQQHPLALS